MRKAWLTLALVLFTLNLRADDLPRRGTAGVAIANLTADESAKLGGNGIRVRAVIPGGPAEKVGIAAEDVLTGFENAIAFTARVASMKPGEKLALTIRRGGETLKKEVTIEPRPLEKSSDYAIDYGFVSADGNRYRTIVTRPKGDGPFPTIFLVQGVGCFSVDNPGPGFSYLPVVENWTRRGFLTLRVDKPGTGDSEGGPCPAVDFQTEVRAYSAALKGLESNRYADKKNIFLFGHSMGGIMAPLVARALPLRGIAVYGTGFNSWLAYTLENTRRQMRLAGADWADVATEEKKQELFASLFYVQRKSLEQILTEHPEFKEDFPDGKTLAAGKYAVYFQQIYDLELAKSWKELDMPVLAMWGSSDFVSNESDHRALAEAMSQWHKGKGTFYKLENTDHWLHTVPDFGASLKQGPQTGEHNTKFDAAIADFFEKNKA